MTTKTRAAIVYVTSSSRVGQITFRSSAATCRMNRAGVVRLAVAPDPLRRSALWPRVWVAMSSPMRYTDPPRAGWPGHIGPCQTALAGQEGLEPPTAGFGDRDSTN